VSEIKELKELKIDTPFGAPIVIDALPPAIAEVFAEMDINDDGTIDAQELEADGALDEVYAALQKLGISDKALSQALGIDPPAIRKARRDQRKSDRDTRKTNKGKKPLVQPQVAERVVARVAARVAPK
jgi:hypothetical protein